MRYFFNHLIVIHQVCIDILLCAVKTCLVFGDVDLIFKVIVLNVGYRLMKWMDELADDLAQINLLSKLTSYLDFGVLDIVSREH